MTDITYIRTHEGWLYLSVVLDLFSRQVVGWFMLPRMDCELAMNALMVAVWRRQSDRPVLVHSDQGRQFSCHDWQGFLKADGLVGSMSRRGNCHDNAWRRAFSSCLSVSGSDGGSIRIKRKPAETYSITSSSSATPADVIATSAGSLR